MDRMPGNFRQQIISRGESKGREHQRAEILAEPCCDDGLQRAIHVREQKLDLCDGKHPRENEKCGHRIPLRGKSKRVAATRPRQHACNRDRGISNEHDGLDVGRQLKEGKSGHITRENARQANGQRKIPENCANGGESGCAQRHAAEARKKPERNAEAGVDRPTINKGRFLRGLDATVGQKGPLAKKLRRVQLDGSDEREHAANHEPENRRADQNQQRAAGGRVDVTDFRLNGDGGSGSHLEKSEKDGGLFLGLERLQGELHRAVDRQADDAGFLVDPSVGGKFGLLVGAQLLELVSAAVSIEYCQRSSAETCERSASSVFSLCGR